MSSPRVAHVLGLGYEGKYRILGPTKYLPRLDNGAWTTKYGDTAARIYRKRHDIWGTPLALRLMGFSL